MKDFFRRVKENFGQGFKEGMGVSAEFDNDFTNFTLDINDPSISDEELYIRFIKFCKKFKLTPQGNHNVEILLIKLMESRPSLQDQSYRKALLDKLRGK
jgi:hypothetical protein